MRAAVNTKYGGPEVVQIIDRPTPSINDNDILIAVKATTVSSADARLRCLNVPTGFSLFARLAFGWFAPRKTILGSECAGVVHAIGKQVQKYQVGDRVFAFPGVKLGCHAEFVVVSEHGPLLPIPDGCGFSEAAAFCFGGSTALHFLNKKAQLKAGEHILIIGAAGTVGSAATQIANAGGARVSAVTSAANSALVKTLGADQVIDYKTQDFCQLPGTYDIIFDAAGSTDLEQCHHKLAAGGRLLLLAANLQQILKSFKCKQKYKKKVFAGPAAESPEDLKTLARLYNEGKFTPVIDSTFPLRDIASAHVYVDTGHKRGSVVITMDS